MWIYHNSNELYHHGILGMKWGVRRYQNEDGSLTSAGKKRYSREYERTAQKVMNKLNKNANRIRINAYNKAADEANNGGIEAFNAQQEKKYGKNFFKRDAYAEEYNKWFNERVGANMDLLLLDFYSNDKDFKKGQSLVDKYGMTEWNELAKHNTKIINKLKRSLNK